jgi:hypothetical protein
MALAGLSPLPSGPYAGESSLIATQGTNRRQGALQRNTNRILKKGVQEQQAWQWQYFGDFPGRRLFSRGDG